MRIPILISLVLVVACGPKRSDAPVPGPPPGGGSSSGEPVGGDTSKPPPGPTDDALVAEAQAFTKQVDAELRRVLVASSEAEWTNQTNITDEHEAAAAKANGELNDSIAKLIKRARKYEPVMAKLDPTTRRELQMLIYGIAVATPVAPSPDDPKQAEELARLGTQMSSIYGKGRACVKLETKVKRKPPAKLAAPTGYQCGAGKPKPSGCSCPAGFVDQRDAQKVAICVAAPALEPAPPPGTQCLDLDELSGVLQKSHNPKDLLAVWQGWHDSVGHAERDAFVKYVGLANAGARSIGFKNVASMWKSAYDMPEDAFEAETDRLFAQMKPLYEQLHCYTRRKLNQIYGDKIAPKAGPIPAHLTGNMWAQAWGWLYKDLEPYPGQAPIDVTPTLEKSFDDQQMVKMAEGFYTSLGMPALPATFWTRSMFQKPEAKQVVCHASAWDVTFSNDLRIKMCIEKTQEDLVTIHHELGHDYYFTHYYQLPVLFQLGANDGFHEAIGDTIALSMTPAYLKERGLLKTVVKNDKATINQQMHTALDKIAFLPFGLVIDKWRWDVFSGKVKPEQYNQRWWELRQQYQGVVAPIGRGPDDFDPGAKYHVPANVPYIRYFLAAVLQFQFHRALCKKAGHTGPLHECSIYKNQAAGEAFSKMLALGASKPWQEALFELTGQREMDATAILEYFAPLKTWLETQNKGQTCGW